MTKYISFSVFGSEEKYLLGAIKNAEIANEVYPQWQTIFYVDDNFSEDNINKLECYGAKVVVKGASKNLNGVFWRFEATGLEDAEVVIFRDADSRLTTREAAAVNEWLCSKFDLHAMRDHPFHSSWILAGMWGARGDLMREISKTVPSSLPGNSKWGIDQSWLVENIYSPHQQDIFIHDSFFKREKSFPFPCARVDGEYVGEVINENGNYSEELRHLVYRAENSFLYLSKLIVRDWFRMRIEQFLSNSKAKHYFFFLKKL